MTDAAAVTVALLTPSDIDEYRRVRLRVGDRAFDKLLMALHLRPA
jgi:hypothetical protein